MNIVSGFLALHVPEEDVFWLMASICERLARPFYESNMVGGLVSQKVASMLVQKLIPGVYKRLGGQMVESLCFRWFLCLFVTTFREEVVLRLLDCFFFRGRVVLFQVALGLFGLFEEKIVEAGGGAGVLGLGGVGGVAGGSEVVAGLFGGLVDVDEERLFWSAFERFGGVTEEMLRGMETACFAKIVKEKREEQQEFQRREEERKRRKLEKERREGGGRGGRGGRRREEEEFWIV